jgi:DNA end-binding protein Ku
MIVLNPASLSEFPLWPLANWKGFPAPFVRHLSRLALSGHVGIRKSLLQPTQPKTSHSIKYAKVDADTREEVANEDIAKG